MILQIHSYLLMNVHLADLKAKAYAVMDNNKHWWIAQSLGNLCPSYSGSTVSKLFSSSPCSLSLCVSPPPLFLFYFFLATFSLCSKGSSSLSFYFLFSEHRTRIWASYWQSFFGITKSESVVSFMGHWNFDDILDFLFNVFVKAFFPRQCNNLPRFHELFLHKFFLFFKEEVVS